MSKDSTRKNSGVIYKWRTPQLVTRTDGHGNAVSNEEQLRQLAFDEARLQGFTAGMEQARKEMAEQTELMTAYVEALSHPFEDQNTQLAEYIATLAGKIARSLVQRELRTDPESLMALVKAAVSALNTSAQKVNIHLNPHNARIIREIIAVDDEKESWNIVDDPLIGMKDCRVSREDSLVDTDLDGRINLIISQFLDDERDEADK